MTKIPEPQNTIANLIDKAHEKRTERPRPHMGCSQLGHPCDRWLWLSFRWAVVEPFPGRILRLFRRGHHEENWIVSDLRAIGIDIEGTTGEQQRVHFGSHVSGSLDGIINSGVPEAPKKRHVAEFKTHSKKSFEELLKKGVKESKPVHWAQCQVYMYGKDIDRALYLAVCKDDDRIYTERVRLDKEAAQRLVDRGRRIATSDRMPQPLSTDPSWYQCKFCAAHSFCHGDHLTKQVNCRTCAHYTACEDSTSHCARWDDTIPVYAQHDGCDHHVLHPDLVPWDRRDSGDDWQALYIIDGKKVRNGAPGGGVFASTELVANPSECANPDPTVSEIRDRFDGRIEG